MGKVLSYEKAKGRFAVVVPGLPNVMFFKLADLISVDDVAPLKPVTQTCGGGNPPSVWADEGRMR
jgi:hypothetical protein